MAVVYVVLLADDDVPKVFKSLSGVARDCVVGRTALSKAMNNQGKYISERMQVYRCELVKSLARGRYNL